MVVANALLGDNSRTISYAASFFYSLRHVKYIKVVEVIAHETHIQSRLMFVKAIDIFIIREKKNGI